MKSTLSERLRLARSKRGLSQKALGELVGISQAAIQKIEVGRAKETTKLLDIARVLDVNPDWLANGVGDTGEQAVRNNPQLGQDAAGSRWGGRAYSWDRGTPLEEDEVEVPFLKDIEFACGDGSVGDDDYSGYSLRFSKSLMRQVGANSDGSGVLCFPATGDSMEPFIPNGSTVAINTNDKKIIDGKVYAINQEGWKRLKRLYRTGPNTVSIRSFNDGGHPLKR